MNLLNLRSDRQHNKPDTLNKQHHTLRCGALSWRLLMNLMKCEKPAYILLVFTHKYLLNMMGHSTV